MAGLVAAIVLQAARPVLINLLSKGMHHAAQAIDTKKAPRQKFRCLLVLPPSYWWAVQVSNLRPPQCEDSGSLPISYFKSIT